MLDDFKVEIDARAAEIGGCWEGKLRNGIPTAWGMDELRFFYERTLEYKSPVILDVGANTGAFSMLAVMNPAMRSYAFEPAPVTFEVLKQNIIMNNLQDRVKALHLALADKNGTAVLKYPKSGMKSGLACIGKPLRFTEWVEYEVEVRRLDDFAGEYGIGKVDLLKIDTEGCELFVLRGAEEFIRQCRPNIFCEYYEGNAKQFGYLPSEIVKFLTSLGYSYAKVSHEDMYFYQSKRVSVTKPHIITSPSCAFELPGKRPQNQSNTKSIGFQVFDDQVAIEINKARQEHLGSLGLELAHQSVLEVGSGLGWHTAFFEELSCKVLSTDARPENVAEHVRRYPHRKVELADLSVPGSHKRFGEFDIIYCYGTLYHLSNPSLCIKELSSVCRKLFLIETCVSTVDNGEINPTSENRNHLNQSIEGIGCCPGRDWVLAELKKYFPFVYVTITQPDHHEFPLNWPAPVKGRVNTRSVFVASRKPLSLPTLSTKLPKTQKRLSAVPVSRIQQDNQEKILDKTVSHAVDEKYLSIVVASRNDDYDANILHRMQVFAKGLAEQCKRFNLDAELIIVEWNPPTDSKRLHEVLDWPDDLGPLTVRFIEVPAEIHNSIGNSDKLPFFQMIAKNVGIRRARGKFVLATNIDILFSNKLMQFLAGGRLDENCFYRIDRHDVGSKILPECKDINKQLEFCRNNIVRVHGLYGTKKISEMESDHFIYDSKDKKLHTNGCGDFTLMSRTNWHLFRAYPELRKWSIYVDGLLLHMAYVSGLHQVILPEPMRIYHIEHDMSWAVSDEAKQKLTTERCPTCRAVALSRLGLDYQKEYLVWCRQMIEAGKPITNNNEHWGYAQTEFKEYVISGRWKGQMTNRNVISQDNDRKPFQEWIDTLALTQNRLYYRDQTPKSLNMLLDLVHRYEPTRIVELGTLSGLSLRAWLAAKSKAEVIAIDLSFKPLFRSQKVLPVELSGVRLLEQDILKTDFRRLWSEEDRLILYVDAHDTPNAPIMAHVLNNAVPALPRSHVIAVDDLWYCSEQVSERSVSEFFKQVVDKEIDYLGCFEGHYAPYWKGGFFIGFPEIVPLMEWVNRNKVDLIFEPGGKVVMFECPAGPANTAGEGFDLEGFNSLTGNLHHNPVDQICIYEEKDVAAGQQAGALCRRAIELFAASRIDQALGCLNRAAGLTSNISGAFYGMGVCLVRLGRFDLAAKMLEAEVSSSFAHPNARILYEDVKNHAAGEQGRISKQARQGQLKGFTIFAMPKGFTGLFATIQRNAIRSWMRLMPSPEIILLGDDDGVADAARRYGCRHIPNVERNEFGTPLLDDIFQKAQAAASNEICVYVNADIILMDNFTEAIGNVARRFSQFLMVGRRWDIDISQEIDFGAEDWQQRLMDRAGREGAYHAPTGIDYFAFKKGLWPEIPPLALGRNVWDNWLVREALLAGRPVIDASSKVTIIHQNHDFSHVPGGKKARSFDIEVRRNLELAGNDTSFAYTSHAAWELTPAGIALRPISEFLKGDNLSAALKCIESSYHQAPEIVAGQCEALGRQMDAGLRAGLLSAAKREVVLGSARNAAKLLLDCLEMENRPAAEELFREGFRCLNEGDALRAVKHLEKAAMNCATLPNVYYALAAAYARSGDMFSARRACRLELSLDPDNRGAAQLLERIDRAANEYRESLVR